MPADAASAGAVIAAAARIGVRVLWDEFRLRVFWQPTKEYSGDKYAMEEEGGDEIQMAMSSYEEAEPGTTPW